MSDIKITSLDAVIKWLDFDIDPTLPDPSKEKVYIRAKHANVGAFLNDQLYTKATEVRILDREVFESEMIYYRDKSGKNRTLHVWRKK